VPAKRAITSGSAGAERAVVRVAPAVPALARRSV
jgi:hypothetical protein